MFPKIIKFSLPLILILLSTGFVFGQSDRFSPKEELPEVLKESLAKRRIKQDEEDFQDLVKRSEEAVKLSEELNKSYEDNKKLSGEDNKKLEKLEKLVKKIRQDLGAEEEKETINNEEKPGTLSNTLTNIKEKSTSLLTELKKTGRFAISVTAVESSNAVFRLVKFLRFKQIKN